MNFGLDSEKNIICKVGCEKIYINVSYQCQDRWILVTVIPLNRHKSISDYSFYTAASFERGEASVSRMLSFFFRALLHRSFWTFCVFFLKAFWWEKEKIVCCDCWVSQMQISPKKCLVCAKEPLSLFGWQNTIDVDWDRDLKMMTRSLLK